MLNIRSERLTLVFTWLLITFPECHFYLLYASDLMSALHPLGRLVFLFFSLSKQLFNNFAWHNVNVFPIHEGRKWVPVISDHLPSQISFIQWSEQVLYFFAFIISFVRRPFEGNYANIYIFLFLTMWHVHDIFYKSFQYLLQTNGPIPWLLIHWHLQIISEDNEAHE